MRVSDAKPVTRWFHISDLHVDSGTFRPALLERLIDTINEERPDLVVVSGDLTDRGLRHEFDSARSWLDRIEVPMVITPGNHDSRNVGYVHFEELFGPRYLTWRGQGVSLVVADSSEPDLDEGRIGRAWYPWINQALDEAEGIRVFCTHHHLLPVPNAGRERNILLDAGDVLSLLVAKGVQLVLTGHKHVPHLWQMEGMLVAVAGTASTIRLRGKGQPSHNVVEFHADRIVVKAVNADGSTNQREVPTVRRPSVEA